MSANIPTPRVVVFGAYAVDSRSGELRKNGTRIKVGEQPLQILLMLLERPGQLVTREELCERLWASDTFVDFESSLNSAVQRLRDCLSDSAGKARWIETVPRRGYRFVGQVQLPGVEKSVGEIRGPTPIQSITEVRPESARESRTGKRIQPHLIVVGLFTAVLAVWLGLKLVNRYEARPGAQVAAIRSVAVLPLENLSGDQSQDYFADGITELLITQLGRVKALRVISHTSVNQYKKTRKTMPEIARELHVDALVEGTVTRSQGRVRVTANLLQAFPEKHLWADTYESDLGDILSLQGEVSQAISRAVRVQLTPEEQVLLSNSRSPNLEAQEAYMKGLFYFARGWDRFFVHAEGQQALHTSSEYFQRAISIDPRYAQAYAGLARSYLWLSDVDGPKAEAGAKAAADKAIALNETLAEPHMVRGFLLLDGDPDWAGAGREFLRSIELNPSYAEAHHGYAIYLSSLGRFDEATAETERAVTLDPFSRAPKSQAAWIDVCAGRYDRGIVRLQNIVELYPDDALSHLGLGTAYVLRGRSQEGITELKKSAILGGQDQDHDRTLGWAYGMAGEREHAIMILNDLKRSSRQEVEDSYGVAMVYAGLGDSDQVFVWLEKAFAARHDALNNLWREPAFIPLRADPRFRTLLHKAGLAV